jgi:Zn-dependent peptidase ImmA (M78 family)/transcriptional regulator with XRE-family HTH domain
MNNVISLGARGRPNAHRLKEARRGKGLSQTELADAVGVTRQAISAYEQGERHPEPVVFASIARALGQPYSYFTGDRPITSGPVGPAFFRSRKTKAKAVNDRCEIWREWFAQCANIFAEFVKLPDVVLPDAAPTEGQFYSDDEVEELAMSCRRMWGLGVGPIANMLSLIESKGIIAGRAGFGSLEVDAFSFWSGQRPMIVLASDKECCVRGRYDTAHELGHLVLHRGIGEEELGDPETLEQIEREANRFAAAFLLPRESYPLEVFTSRIDGFVQLKERWKVAVSAQVTRCLHLGLIGDDQALNLRKQISKRNWRKREPLDDVLKPEEPILLRKCFDLVTSSRTISASELVARARLDPVLLAQFYNVALEKMAPPPSDGPQLRLTGDGGK